MDNDATMLQFDWEDVEGATITAVLAEGARSVSDGSLMCAEIGLVVGAKVVVIRVNDDTDELIVTHQDFATSGTAWQPLDQLEELVSRTLGWCWIGRNYRGYLDTFTLALDGIDPAYSFTGLASSIQCARVTPIRA